MIETEPEWGILATGPFNDPKDGASPLTGVIESDWLPYPFTMNWQLTRPGIVRFEEGEPFCFILPVPLRVLPETELQIHRLADDPQLEARHNQFREARNEFMARVRAGDQGAIKEAWQRHYFVGRHPDGVACARASEQASPQGARRRARSRATRNRGSRGAGARQSSESDPRWAADSPLNRVATYSGTVDIPNRARMDGEGRFTPGPDTQDRVDARRGRGARASISSSPTRC